MIDFESKKIKIQIRIQNDFGFFSKEIDVIIAPGFTFPAPPVKHPARLVPAVSYTAAYNVLDFPVGSVPITRVIPQDEVCQYYLINYSLEAIFDCFWSKFTVLLPTTFPISPLEVFQSPELFPNTRYANTI